MYRRVVLYNDKWVSGSVDVLYHVHGADQLSQCRKTANVYDSGITPPPMYAAVVFGDSVRLRANSGVAPINTFEFVVDVSENQPEVESVEEITTTGSRIVVFNENGVVVCRNTPKTPASGDLTQTDAPGEMTSVPGEEPGEMTSEPIDVPGEMTSVPGEEPGEMAGETTNVPSAVI